MFKLVEITCGIKLSYNVSVGRNVRIEHFGGMILGARHIGNNVTIRQNTTFGIASKNDRNAKPIIDDYVDIGCGSVIVGDIYVGHHSIIGANSVVLKDVPPHSVVAGAPAKVVKSLIKKQNLIYPMEKIAAGF